MGKPYTFKYIINTVSTLVLILCGAFLLPIMFNFSVVPESEKDVNFYLLMIDISLGSISWFISYLSKE
jgi:hypothetical protein